MVKIINIEAGRGFKSNEYRILELDRQIKACQDRILQLQKQAINANTPTDRGNIRNEEEYFRNTQTDLIEELTRLQKP
jgi:cell fate (sporulation/competence/biofilm development) regulator YmcA (YheA/YmcA/DUF963 family)